MRLTTILTGAAALGLVSVPAFAADVLPAPPEVAPAIVAPAPPPVFTWTGGYVGGHAGLGRGALNEGTTCDPEGVGGLTDPIPIYFIVEEPFGDDIDWDGSCFWTLSIGPIPIGFGSFGEPDLTPPDVNPGVGTPSGIAGYLAGAQIGFNLQLGSGRVGFVIGAEVAFSMTSLAAQLNAEHWLVGWPQWNSEFRINYLATATLRAGLAFGKVLLYGEGGLALANATWVNTLGFSDTVTDHGYVFGAGLEAMVSRNVSLFFEWNRVVIPEHRFLGSIDAFVIPLPTGIDVSSRTDIFKVGFNIRIGRDTPEI